MRAVHRDHDRDRLATEDAAPAPRPGRASLTDGLAEEDDADRPLFEGARWEMIEDPGDGAHEQAQLAHLQTAPEDRDAEGNEEEADDSSEAERELAEANPNDFIAAGSEEDGDAADDDDDGAPALTARSASLRNENEEATDGDDRAIEPAAAREEAADRDADGPVAQAANAARPPIQEPARERTLKNPRRGHFAATDSFNKKIKRRKGGKKGETIDRAGVRLGGRDKFKVKRDAPRFVVVEGVATPKDKITKASLVKGRLAINPTTPRRLTLPDRSKPMCVLTWSGSKGAAFMPAKYLASGDASTSKILRAVRRDAKKKQPGHASAEEMKDATRYVFIDEPIAHPRGSDDKRYVVPDQKAAGANKIEHYLINWQGKVNVVMNLPQPKVAPIAADVVDIGTPGQHFFVPHGEKFYRQIALYRRGTDTANVLHTFVFGYLAKIENNAIVPDRTRRGWVSLRVVKKG